MSSISWVSLPLAIGHYGLISAEYENEECIVVRKWGGSEVAILEALLLQPYQLSTFAQNIV